MHIFQMLSLLLGVAMLCTLPCTVVATLQFDTNCTEQQQQDLHKYLKGAQDMASENYVRLQGLLRYLHGLDGTGKGVDVKPGPLRTARWTFAAYVDRGMLDYKGTTENPENKTLEKWTQENIKPDKTRNRLIIFINRNFMLWRSIQRLRQDPAYTQSQIRPLGIPEPNITFLCDDRWYEKVEAPQPPPGKKKSILTRFRDIRKKKKPSEPPAPDFTFGNGGDNGRMPSNDDNPPDLFAVPGYLETKISISTREFAVWNMTVAPPGGEDDLAKAIYIGENDYSIMRKNKSIEEGDFYIENLLRYHGDLHLLTMFANMEQMAAGFVLGPESNPERTGAANRGWSDDPCRKYSYNNQLNFQCVNKMAKKDPDGATKSSYVYSLLATALYLDDWDWSSGRNFPDEDFDVGGYQPLQKGGKLEHRLSLPELTQPSAQDKLGHRLSLPELTRPSAQEMPSQTTKAVTP